MPTRRFRIAYLVSAVAALGIGLLLGLSYNTIVIVPVLVMCLGLSFGLVVEVLNAESEDARGDRHSLNRVLRRWRVDEDLARWLIGVALCVAAYLLVAVFIALGLTETQGMVAALVGLVVAFAITMVRASLAQRSSHEVEPPETPPA